MGRPAAIFDLDGTLLARTSAERVFVGAALRARRLDARRAARGLAVAALARLRGRTRTFSESKTYLAGAACAPLETLGVDCVYSLIRPRLRPSLLVALEAHRERGDALVLLTGTLDFLGTEVARMLGIEFAITAELERCGGHFTGRVLGPYPHGPGKLVALMACAATAGLDLGRSHAYANRGSDALHLERVGFAHAVAPDRRLRRAARAHGWEVVEE